MLALLFRCFDFDRTGSLDRTECQQLLNALYICHSATGVPPLCEGDGVLVCGFTLYAPKTAAMMSVVKDVSMSPPCCQEVGKHRFYPVLLRVVAHRLIYTHFPAAVGQSVVVIVDLLWGFAVN